MDKIPIVYANKDDKALRYAKQSMHTDTLRSS